MSNSVYKVNGHNVSTGAGQWIVDGYAYYGYDPMFQMQSYWANLGANTSLWDAASRESYNAIANLFGLPLATGAPNVLLARPHADVGSEAPQISDSDFVTGLYQTYYHRAPDAPGLAFWVNELTSARKDRAGVEAAFATSPDIVTPTPTPTPTPTSTPSTIPIVGPVIDGIATLPLVGPAVNWLSTATGIGKEGIVIGAIVLIGLAVVSYEGSSGGGRG